MGGFGDPNAGAPIFSLPRAVPVEIRAPDENRGSSQPTANGQTSQPSHSRTPSKLRTNASVFEPGRPNGAPAYPSLDPQHSGNSQPYGSANGGMMHYHAAYQQQPYYYPEHYGYPPYVEMPQAGQFDAYADPSQHGTVYY